MNQKLWVMSHDTAHTAIKSSNLRCKSLPHWASQVTLKDDSQAIS